MSRLPVHQSVGGDACKTRNMGPKDLQKFLGELKSFGKQPRSTAHTYVLEKGENETLPVQWDTKTALGQTFRFLGNSGKWKMVERRGRGGSFSPHYNCTSHACKNFSEAFVSF